MSQINAVFNYQGKPITVQCSSNDSLNHVFDRFCVKAGLERSEPTFYYQSKKVERSDDKLGKLNINNHPVFDVVLAQYVVGA